ncbi:MAG TPA: triose-phosphate isomerase, partial [Halieaceae bacterium]|nr:triose-phosphate isomerase [Halieaceae bacterium]
RKLAAALAAGLCPILCLGETAPERERGLTLMRLRGQLDLALAGLAQLPASGARTALEQITDLSINRDH